MKQIGMKLRAIRSEERSHGFLQSGEPGLAPCASPGRLRVTGPARTTQHGKQTRVHTWIFEESIYLDSLTDAIDEKQVCDIEVDLPDNEGLPELVKGGKGKQGFAGTANINQRRRV